MENNANQLQNQPMLCKKNCGFFGNASLDGYCSKCYKDHVKKQNTGSAAGRVTPTTSTTTTLSTNNNSEIKINHESTVTSTTASSSFSAAPAAATTTATHSIPIPARQQSSKLNEDFGMSVPVDITTAISSAAAAATNSSNSAAIASSLCGGENMMMACSVDETSTSPLACSMGAEKKKRTRCSVESCKRKVGLTGFDCRCGGLFCWEHRYSDKHECKFDYKELGQDQIRKNNPVVVGEKIQKI